jgi:hypothetical protein
MRLLYCRVKKRPPHRFILLDKLRDIALQEESSALSEGRLNLRVSRLSPYLSNNAVFGLEKYLRPYYDKNDLQVLET